MIAGLCPTTEANLGDGIFPADRFLEAKGAIAIGSDSHITRQPGRGSAPARIFAAPARPRPQCAGRRPGPIDRPHAARCRARRRRHSRWRSRSARMAPGCRADIAVLDDEHPALIGRKGDQILDSWIFSGGNACVQRVFVAGKHVVEDRRQSAKTRSPAAFAQGCEANCN